MPQSDDEEEDQWEGRPQDNPRLLARMEARRIAFRERHPPVDCWIDRVWTLELYLGSVRCALVARRTALITYFDTEGRELSTALYLRSESAFDIVEAHLGIERVEEVRDESSDADEILTSLPRDHEEYLVNEFRQRHHRDDEIFSYLRDAVHLLVDEANVSETLEAMVEPARAALLKAITDAVQGRFESALTSVRAAVEVLEDIKERLLIGESAMTHTRRAALAIERHMVLQKPAEPLPWPTGAAE